MEKQGMRIIISLALIGLGALFLLNNLGVLPFDLYNNEVLWAVLFGLGGLIFLGVFLTSRENWWAAIPGFTLLGLAMLVGRVVSDATGGGVFLGMIGLSFLVIYLTHRDFWWALIPGGVLVTLSVIAGGSELIGGLASGAILFLGIGMTFLLLYFLPTPDGRLRWAIWPASILLAMGMLLMLGAVQIIQYIWPAALILGGIWLVTRTVRPREQ